jgi:ATP-dependent Clp protease ATP-binding subunit ClpX
LKGQSRTFRRRAVASILIRNSSRSTRLTFSLSAVGAFVGLEKVIERRLRNKSLGFHAEVKSGMHRHAEALAAVQPEDLIRFGLIPEFVGRLPVAGVLHELDEGALIKILTNLRMPLVKQYQKKFDLTM